MDTIPFVVSVPEESDQDTKGIFSFLSRDEDIGVCEIPIEHLQRNLGNICQGVLKFLGDVKKVGDFRLKEVTIQVEVNAEGGVNLIGTAKLGGKGAITLKFSE